VSWWQTSEKSFNVRDPAVSEAEQDEALIKALQPYILLA